MKSPLPQQGEMAVLLAVGVALAPLLLQLPFWLPLLVLLMLALRAGLWKRQAAMPSLRLLLPLLLLAMVGLWLSLNTLVGREGGVALLALLIGFKAFECRQLRDWQVLLALGFFAAATPLLFLQSLWSALWLVLTMLVLTWAMLLLAGELPQHSGRVAAGSLALSLPLMVMLFVVMPRLPGPLWSMPHDQHAASTGLSDSMEPGSISQLVQDGQPAFSVVFSSQPPAISALYWRVMVFDGFDGQRWQNLGFSGHEDRQDWPLAGNVVHYSLTGRPAKSRLPMLDYPLSAPTGAVLEAGRVLRLNRDSEDLYRFQGMSLLADHYPVMLSRMEQAFYLRLPAGNLASRQLAASLRQQGGSDISFIRAALSFFRLGSFSYTLTPPLLQERDGIDQFLFSTHQGFCEHYASALAFLARAAGIPARVVVGYQGGEFNSVGKFWQVRSSDAHAWVEVWLHDVGQWQRVDPTAAVAPGRISQGPAQALPGLQPGLPLLGGETPGWLHSALQDWQALGFAWQQWVLAYDAGKQRQLFQFLGLGEDVDASSVARALLFGGVLACLPLLLLWRRREKANPLKQGRACLVERLARCGVSVLPADGPLDILNKARGLAGDDYRRLKFLLKQYAALRYAQDSPSSRSEQQWLRQVRAFRPGGRGGRQLVKHAGLQRQTPP